MCRRRWNKIWLRKPTHGWESWQRRCFVCGWTDVCLGTLGSWLIMWDFCTLGSGICSQLMVGLCKSANCTISGDCNVCAGGSSDFCDTRWRILPTTFIANQVWLLMWREGWSWWKPESFNEEMISSTAWITQSSKLILGKRVLSGKKCTVPAVLTQQDLVLRHWTHV